MREKTQIKYKYTCKYCDREYDEAVALCEGCGASDFIESSYVVESASSKKSKAFLKKALIVIGIIIAVNILLTVIVGILDAVAMSKYKKYEYDYSSELINDPNVFMGKTMADAEKDFNTTIKISGSFNDLYENVYNNIYSSQLISTSFDMPCDIEVKTDEFTLHITELGFSYYSNAKGYVEPASQLTGKIKSDIELFLVDSQGNKDRLLIEQYNRDKYDSIASYLSSDEYRKDFTISNSLIIYDKLLITVDGEAYEFELDYGRANGDVTYYGLKTDE